MSNNDGSAKMEVVQEEESADGSDGDVKNIENTELVEEDEVSEEEDEDEDDEGWITPNNIKKVKQTFGAAEETKIEDGSVKCACLTTDFAMQVDSINSKLILTFFLVRCFF